jgi:hypothetical protein
MLGRGGFSEVWKALDLVELREVAVKVSHKIGGCHEVTQGSGFVICVMCVYEKTALDVSSGGRHECPI